MFQKRDSGSKWINIRYIITTLAIRLQSFRLQSCMFYSYKNEAVIECGKEAFSDMSGEKCNGKKCKYF